MGGRSPICHGWPYLRRHQRDSTEYHRGTHSWPSARAPETVMRFLPTDEHLAFSEAIDGIVEAHGGPEIARAWGKGELHKGAKLWTQFVETGLMSLCLTAEEGGLGGTAADLI